MRAGTVRWTTYGVGLAALATAAVTGCSSSSSSAAASGTSSPAASGTSAQSTDATGTVQLAAKTTADATSVTGNLVLQITSKAGASASASPAASAAAGSGNLSATATFAERLRPSLTGSVTYQSMSSGGTTLPGGLSAIITPTEFYLKWSYLTDALKLSKPWLAIPVSQLSQSSGVNLSQILGSAAGGSPLSGSQVLSGASSVRKVGTGTVGGIPVTEYTGTLDLDKSLAALSGTTKTQLQQAITKSGFKTGTFTVWVDGSHQIRKEVATLTGSTMTETTTTTITSINKPVNISLPAANQTTTAPTSSLSSGTS